MTIKKTQAVPPQKKTQAKTSKKTQAIIPQKIQADARSAIVS